MAYARNRGIWPRPEPETRPGDYGQEATQGGAKSSRIRDPGPSHPDDEGGTSRDTPTSVTAEGVLRDAFVQLWEQARAQRMEKVGMLSIRMFEAGDAFRLLGAVGAVSGAGKEVHGRLRNPRRGIIRVGLHGSGAGRATGQGVPGTPDSCRPLAEPGSRIRADSMMDWRCRGMRQKSSATACRGSRAGPRTYPPPRRRKRDAGEFTANSPD